MSEYYPQFQWYKVDVSKLPADLCEHFMQSDEDEETKTFIESCYDKADWVVTQMTHLLVKSFLSWFMTPTSING